MITKEQYLAPYLPYGLKILEITKGNFECDPRNENKELLTYRNISRFIGKKPYKCLSQKPILIPLSFCKGNIIREIRIELDLTHNQTMEFLGFIDGEIQLQNISYGLFLSMCKNHIDFNNLIPAGLAIDINTLKN